MLMTPRLFIAFALAIAATAAHAAPPSLVGSWALVADDDPKATKPLPRETLHFFGDGRLYVEGKTSYVGAWETSKDQLTMILSVDGRELDVVRPFILAGDKLRLANSDAASGHAHYARRAAAPSVQMPEAPWSEKASGRIALKVPPGWSVREEPPSAAGHQRVMLANRDQTKSLMVTVTSSGDAGPQAPVAALVEGTATQMTKAFGGSAQKSKAATLHGVPAVIYEGTIEKPMRQSLTVAGTSAGSATVLIAVMAERDKLKEIERVVRSIRVDGKPLAPPAP